MSVDQEPVRPVPGWDAPGGEAPQPTGLLPADAARLRGRQHPADRTLRICQPSVSLLSASVRGRQHRLDRTLNLYQPSVNFCQHLSEDVVSIQTELRSLLNVVTNLVTWH